MRQRFGMVPAGGDNFIYRWIRKVFTAIPVIEIDDQTGQIFSAGVALSTPSLVQSSTVTLSAAQIRTLPTVFPEIIAAPGVGKYINLIQAIISSNITLDFGNLAGDGSADIQLTFGDNGTNATTTEPISNLMTSGPGLMASLGQLIGTSGIVINKAAFANKKITIASDNSSGNFTGGDGTLIVTVYYTVVTLS